MKLLTLALFAAVAAPAQTPPDPSILQAVQSIKAIDDHSHPPKLVNVGERDDDYDALPCDPLEPAPMPAKFRDDNPQYIQAWKALYGYRYNDMEPAHVKELVQAKQRAKQQHGDGYSVWVLDQLNIETELANRVAMGRGLTAPRFRWIAFADPLLIVRRDNLALAYTPDRRIFYAREQALLGRYMQELGVAQIPPTIQQYVATVVVPMLQRWKEQGAVAIKFEAAYLRQLSFDPTTEAEASDSYKRVNSGPYSVADYKHVQDYLFRRIAAEAGKLELPIQIHTGIGCGSYFRLEGANPALLESVFNDSTLRHTKFVVLHAGWPYQGELAALLTKPNVYADFSQITWMHSARLLAETLRPWLEMYPEKVMFGTDLSPNTPEVDWEEIGWLTTRDARVALASTLSDMVRDGVITEERALLYANMVLHDNAARLYKLGAAAGASAR